VPTSSSSSRSTISTMSVGSDDSESSDLTSYYCLDCDTRHELSSDASPFVCGVKYSSDEESIDKENDVVALTTMQVAHRQSASSSTLKRESRSLRVSTPHAPTSSDDEMARPAAATPIALSLSPGKSGMRLVMPWSTTPASLSEYRQAPSTLITLFSRRTALG
jgi:hypothetical protein